MIKGGERFDKVLLFIRMSAGRWSRRSRSTSPNDAHGTKPLLYRFVSAATLSCYCNPSESLTLDPRDQIWIVSISANTICFYEDIRDSTMITWQGLAHNEDVKVSSIDLCVCMRAVQVDW